MPNIPSGYVWIKDLEPDAQWNAEDQSISLNDGRVIPKTDYVNVSGKSYINPTYLAAGKLPQANTAYTQENYDRYLGMAKDRQGPEYEQRQTALSNLVSDLTAQVNAKIAGLQSTAAGARLGLNMQERGQADRLRGQSIARGTYTSGVADYSQRKLAESYGPQYRQLEGDLASAEMGANAQLGPALRDIGQAGASLESQYMTNTSQAAYQDLDKQYGREQDSFKNFLSLMGSSQDQEQVKFDNALTRATTFGEVMTEEDERYLGAQVGTETWDATWSKKINNMNLTVAAVNLTGKVTTQEQADILGVDIGTPSDVAKQAGLNRANSAYIAKMQIESNERLVKEQSNLDEAISMWELTGTAPQNEALQKYGVTVGTAWTPSLEEQITQYQVDAINDEKWNGQVIKAANTFAGHLLKGNPNMTSDTAELISLILYYNPLEEDGRIAYAKVRDGGGLMTPAGDVSVTTEGIDWKVAGDIISNMYSTNQGNVANVTGINELEAKYKPKKGE